VVRWRTVLKEPSRRAAETKIQGCGAQWREMGVREWSRCRVSPSSALPFASAEIRSAHWMDSNLARLATTFRRPILGIHNSTYGIVFDVIECVIQRTFGYPTLDIRTAYNVILDLLRQKEVTKLVLISHSQGAIEAGMVLDWLYATLSDDYISKLEVYTFGNAANHWNCPQQQNGERSIKHVEHYANSNDWVSRFGVLHFRGIGQPPQEDLIAKADTAYRKLNRVVTGQLDHDKLSNRFVGKLFIREASGHQFNQHYLDNMFTMDKIGKKVLEGNDFMNSVIDGNNFEDSTGQVTVVYNSRGLNGVNGSKHTMPVRLIKDESRLWRYRNGGVPHRKTI